MNAETATNTNCPEDLLTVKETAAALRWSYDTARRYFQNQPGVLVRFRPNRYKRPYKVYMIPRSVFEREWNRMASFNSASANLRGEK